jgi:predicted ATPase
MKITFHNFGIVEEAEIDLKPLTIFIGPNNVGKTWTAYAIACIFGPYGFSVYSNAYIQREIPDTYSSLDNCIEQVIKNGAVTIDVVQFAADCGEIYFNNLAHYVQHWIARFLGTELASLENLNVSIDLSETKTAMLERIQQPGIRIIAGSPENALITLRKAPGDRNISIYLSAQATSSKEEVQELPPDIIKDFIISNVLQLLHRAIYPEVRILPTERTTFIAHPPTVSIIDRIREIVPTKDQTTQEQKIRSAPGAVSYYLSMMQHIDNQVEMNQREQAVKNISQIKKYVQLAKLLEEQILGGEVIYSEQGAIFRPSANSKLEISVASSMVKELSPLLFYLRHFAEPRDLIIIDEPEMNLHPEAQVKIIEFLAMLVNADLNVLITTHSSYVTDHLANLIKASEVEDKESIRNEFYLKRADAFIHKDNVSVYLFSQKQAIKVIDEKGVIDLDTFGKVSDRISDIYFTL